MKIDYVVNPSNLRPEDVFALLGRSGIAHPDKTIDRISRAIDGSAVIATAWHDGCLVGYSNAISDLAWIGYISQLAVDPKYQGQGIGKMLVEKIKQTLGDEVTLVVHSADTAKDFYRVIGFEEYNNVFKKSRTR